MSSREIICRAERWPLSRPFRISRGTKTLAEVVVVEIRAAGRLGRGEGVPYSRYDESVESAVAQVEQIRPALEGGLSRTELLSVLPPGAARNAVDCALWDLEAQFPDAPQKTELSAPGSPVGPVTTAVTISLDDPDAMAAAAQVLSHVPLLKIKVDAHKPEIRIRRIREVCPLAALIVDPNESWDADILRAVSPVLRECRVALLEQPLPAGREADLVGLKVPVPICADESCHTSPDLPNLKGIFQFVNIKLDKTGGLTGALELLQKAREGGFGIMVGCMISTSLSIAPALRIAAAAAFVDLDGPWWLKRDRRGGVVLQAGRLEPPSPGFWGDVHDEHFESIDAAGLDIE
jgi:L-Ala-D/L-Glu epimerase